ncbi:hypothetical protein A3F66_04790 [candidate division TM6 bacterium RIFCSPHIGHO2_12_FULL_32_22]|nr:MAG: hypothetical protein A3F66_04790 [candidate division TM6 bacterium RIFCSPHIGHO2_12_FULL_32_22]
MRKIKLFLFLSFTLHADTILIKNDSDNYLQVYAENKRAAYPGDMRFVIEIAPYKSALLKNINYKYLHFLGDDYNTYENFVPVYDGATYTITIDNKSHNIYVNIK